MNSVKIAGHKFNIQKSVAFFYINNEISDRKCRFDPWVRKMPWWRKQQPTPVFLPEIPWTEERGGLQFMGLQRVGHN